MEPRFTIRVSFWTHIFLYLILSVLSHLRIHEGQEGEKKKKHKQVSSGKKLTDKSHGWLLSFKIKKKLSFITDGNLQAFVRQKIRTGHKLVYMNSIGIFGITCGSFHHSLYWYTLLMQLERGYWIAKLHRTQGIDE